MRCHRVVDRRALLLDLGDLLGNAGEPRTQPPGLRANPDGLVPGVLRANREPRLHQTSQDRSALRLRSTQEQATTNPDGFP